MIGESRDTVNTRLTRHRKKTNKHTYKKTQKKTQKKTTTTKTQHRKLKRLAIRIPQKTGGGGINQDSRKE